MLDIRINEQSLDLRPGTRLRYTLSNPIFDADGLPRGYSFPFRIPATPRNLKNLGYANRLDIRDKKRKYPGELRINGIPLETGIIQITGGSGTDIEIVLKNMARDLIDQLSMIRIRDLLSTINIPDISGAGELRYFLEDTESWTIKIDDTIFAYSNAGATQAQGQIELITLIDAVYPGLAVPFSTDHIELLTNQYPNLNYQVSEWLNVTYVSGQTVYEGKQSNVQTFINNLATTPRADITFPTTYAFYFHDRNTHPAISQFLNYYLDGNNIDNVPTPDKSWNHSYVPFIRIPYLIEKVFEKLGYTTAGSLFQSEWVQQLIYYTNRAIDELVEGDFGPGLKYFNQYQQSIHLPDFVPDITADELLKWIDFLNYYFEIDGSQLKIQSRVAPLRQPPIDWTDKQEEDYAFDLPQNQGYRLEYAPIEGELSTFDNQIQPYSDGENEQDFVIRPFYTGLFGNNVGSSTWALIGTNKPGSSETIGRENEADIRLAFDRGLQQDQAGQDYVYAAANDIDSFGNATYQSSLLLEGDNGVYQSHWAGYIELADAPTIKRRFQLSIADILELKKWRNPMRYLYDPRGAVVAIIKRVSLRIDDNGLGLADIEFILKRTP